MDGDVLPVNRPVEDPLDMLLCRDDPAFLRGPDVIEMFYDDVLVVLAVFLEGVVFIREHVGASDADDVEIARPHRDPPGYLFNPPYRDVSVLFHDGENRLQVRELQIGHPATLRSYAVAGRLEDTDLLAHR